MRKLSGKERKYLRGLAHSMKPVVQVGAKGMTATLIGAVNEALDTHELIKVKFIEFKEDRKEIAADIAEEVKAELVGMIGNIAIFYRENEKEEKRKIDLSMEED